MKINYNTFIDYKLFVPDPQGKNYIEFTKTGNKFLVDLIYSVQINYLEDRVVYWIYFTIPYIERYSNLLRSKNIQATLCMGNVKYLFIGTIQILQKIKDVRENMNEIKASFIVNNASRIRENIREEIKRSRLDMMDIEDE
ncbi:hypothetical protein LCGC14_1421140 [marine sediment metagenome]|uniref:Uncharacterized protein n=1 Tax=marine sediment metagenome TaxID=412755 RepID=A0A0F9KCL5_9ZZZZ